MTTGATGQLGLALPVQGELSGTWGDTVNNGITQYTNIAIAATLTLTGDGAVTLTNTTGDATASNITSTLTGAGTVTAQFAIVKVSGTLTTTKVVTFGSAGSAPYSKTYLVVNAATGGAVTFKAYGQTGVSIAVGESALVYYNGTDIVKLVGTATAGAAGGSTTQVQYNSSGSLAGSANMTFDGTSMTLGGNPTLSAGTANGVTYLNGSKVLTSGSALTFDGTNLSTSGYYIGTAAVGRLTKSNTTGRNLLTGGITGGTTDGAYIITEGYDYGGTAAGGAINLVTAGASSPITFLINGTEGMRLTSTGLGIGTSSPTEKLQVSGAVRVTGAVTANTTGAILSYQGSSTVMLGSWGADASTYGAIQFYQANSLGTLNRTAMLLDTSGNLGLGVTPSAWSASYKALQSGNGSAFVGFNGNDQTFVVSNAYNNGTNWIYKNTAGAGYYGIQGVSNGVHAWFTAPSGTAGATISFTQAMTLDASGNLLIGGTAARGTTVGAAHLDLFNGTAPAGTLTNGVSLYSSSGDLKFMNATGDGFDVGYRNIPQNSQSAAYTTVLADSGKCIYHPTTDANARTFTIASNASVPYPIGTVIQFVNMTSQVVTIAINTDTMYLAGTGTTGSRSLAIYGVANAMKMTSTTWIITGSGLT